MSFEPLSDEELIQRIELYNQNNRNITATAQALGITRSSMQHSLRVARERGMDPGWSEDDKWRSVQRTIDGDGQLKSETQKLVGADPDDVPTAGILQRTTTLYRHTPEGKEVLLQWQRAKAEDVAREAMWRAIADGLKEGLPKVDLIPPPDYSNSDLCHVIPVGDLHLGGLSWKHETDGSWDLEIAEDLLVRACNHLISLAPPCDSSVIALLGDFLHYDSAYPVTPINKHILASDSRYPKMIRVAIKCARYMIEAALHKHQNVHVIVEIGNHDLNAAPWLAECLAGIYEDNPRVTVDTSPKHYHYYEFGSVLVGTHHGHETKMPALPMIMATDMPEAWGRTKFRYWYTGHVHYSETQAATSAKDYSGCRVESFRVLGPNDAYAMQQGYRSFRDLVSIILHKRWGEIDRKPFNPSMLVENQD